MSGFYEALLGVLKQDARLFTEDGEFLRNAALELGFKADADVLRLLLSDETISAHFFADVDDVKVFDSQKFAWVVSNREFLPDSFTRFKNAIGLVDRRGLSFAQTRDVELVWPYKDCVLEGGQTDDTEKRTEVFWNETLAPDEVDRLLSPKVLSSARRVGASPSEDVCAFDDSESLVVKGNNLLVLASLVPRYAGRVKMVYIDPPFNPPSPNNTFSYNNRFNHSTWLTFMANRLRLAKRLLAPDGVLVVAIDDNEQCYLGVLLDELFPEHRIHCITIVHNPRGTQAEDFSPVHEYAFFVVPAMPKGQSVIAERTLEETEWSNFRNWGGESERSDGGVATFYAVIVKDGEVVGFGDPLPECTCTPGHRCSAHPSGQTVIEGDRSLVYPIDTSGVERKWRYARQNAEDVRLKAKPGADGRLEIEIGKNTGQYKTVWYGAGNRYDANAYGTQLVRSLVPDCGFSFPKSLYNVLDCVKAAVGQDKNAIVLDFFAGSGTTAHAVLELNKEDGGNRRFILVEQMDYVEDCTVKRVQRVMQNEGKGSFVYCELKQLNQQYVERIAAAKDSAELLTLWEEVKDSSFISFRVRPQDFDSAAFAQLTVEQQRELLLTVLDKNLLYVDQGDLDNGDYAISEQDKAFNRSFYALGESS